MDFPIIDRLNNSGLLSWYDRFGPFNGIGHLGFPRPVIEPFQSSLTYGTRVHSLFRDPLGIPDDRFRQLLRVSDPEFLSELNRRSATVKELLAELHADARVSALNEMMIFNGKDGFLFDVSTLAAWYLWHANEVGLEAARTHLNQWLDADEVEVVNTLWVGGIAVSDELPLADGFRIVPGSFLPHSDDSEQEWNTKTAIARNCRVRKTHPHRDPREFVDAHYWEVRQQLLDIALLLNTLGVCCVPVASGSYWLPTQPFGPIWGNRRAEHIQDVVGIIREPNLSQGQQADVLSAFEDFKRLTPNNKNRFRRVLQRLSHCKRRLETVDRILELGIALEMLLLNELNTRDQLSLTFRLRGAWLAASTPEERLENYELLREIYNYRSQAAHNGFLDNNDTRNAEERFPKYVALTERICRILLCQPDRQWDRLVLGVFA